MGNRDFAKTSGAINSKFGDKSDLMYFIYDILDDQMSYRDRARELMALKGHISPNIVILKLLDKVTVYPNPEYNSKVDYWLDFIVGKGGEGIILRDPDATYYHSKNSGDRRPCLLKYKQVKTCDLRIVGWNEGKDKYTGMIGSFICENDEQTVRVSVAGIDDATRMSDPRTWIGKIIEVLYFDISKSDSKDVFSLQFPRFKQVRDDKTETSMF
jgi:DNA ligase-1